MNTTTEPPRSSHNKGKFIDRTGQEFGRLRVLRTYMRQFTEGNRSVCDCECAPDLGGCGTKLMVRTNALVSQNGTESCGCLRDEENKKRRAGA